MSAVVTMTEHDAELEELWQLNNKPGWNRQALLSPKYSPSETFVQRHWKELNVAERHSSVTHCTLSMKFLRDHWAEFTETERKTCCQKQELTMKFIKSIWIKLNEGQKPMVARHQKLAPEFIMQQWTEMTWWCRVMCIRNQQRFPARLVIEDRKEADQNAPSVEQMASILNYAEQINYYCGDLTRAELPEYLSCEIDGIRLSAEERLRELGGDRK